MNRDDLTAALETIRTEETTRLAFQNVFKEHTDGPFVLAAIAVACGHFETDPAKIRPDLVSFFHWLLERIGTRHDGETAAQSFEDEVQSILHAANSNDLVAMRKNLESRRDLIDGGNEYESVE